MNTSHCVRSCQRGLKDGGIILKIGMRGAGGRVFARHRLSRMWALNTPSFAAMESVPLWRLTVAATEARPTP